MEFPPQFDYRDILAAPARAVSAKQILVMTLFLCIALLLFDLGYYGSIAIEGRNFNAALSVYGIFPFNTYGFDHPLAMVVYGAGALAALLSFMLGMFSVAAINIESIRGNRFFSATGAVKFASKRIGQILLSELSIVLFLLVLVLVFAVYGLVSRIPAIGETLYSLLFLLPSFIIALFAVFIGFVMLLSVVLLPAVAAAERQGESFGVILETFSSIMRRPFRWLTYTATAVVLAKVCSFVYAYFAYRAVQFLAWSSSIGGGEDISKLIRGGLSHLPVRHDLVREMCQFFPGLNWGFEIPSGAIYYQESFASYVMAVMLFLIGASAVGYGFAILAAAQARAYVAIRYQKDKYNIAAEPPMFFTDEHINPPIA